MAKRPDGLIYSVDEVPPLWATLSLGLQHTSAYAVGLLFPVVLMRAAGGSEADTARLVSMSMIAGGLGAILQCLTRGPVGSGFLCPQLCGPAFLAASILAVKQGGVPLLCGMTIVAGAGEALFSRVVRRLRVLFPTEVTGLIVAMVGISVTHLAVENFFGISEDSPGDMREFITGAVTLATMTGLNIWGRGKIRLFSILAGMIVGYVTACLLGVADITVIAAIKEKDIVAAPWHDYPGLAFNSALLAPFFIAMVCSSLKSLGDLTTCQRINDAEWHRPDMGNIGKGVLADAVGCVTSGLLGGMGQSTSSMNVGLSIATAATSRVIAYAAGAFLILLGCCPKLAHLFVVMPAPVMGATLLFALAFMVVAGMQIIMSRMMDSRKTAVVGLSMIFGLSVDIVPGAYPDGPAWAMPILGNSLSMAMLMAIVLNLLFRLGISRRVSIELTPGVDTSRTISAFMNRQGGIWGARPEVIYNATAAMNEFMEARSGPDSEGSAKPLTMTVSFDEFNLDVDIRYEGEPVHLPKERPSHADLRADPAAGAHLAAFLMRGYADNIRLSQDEDGAQHARLHFDH